MGFLDTFLDTGIKAAKTAGRAAKNYVEKTSANYADKKEHYENWSDSRLLSGVKNTSSPMDRTAMNSVLKGRGYTAEDIKNV